MNKLYNCGMWKLRHVKSWSAFKKAERKLIVVGKQILDTNNTITPNFPYL